MTAASSPPDFFARHARWLPAACAGLGLLSLLLPALSIPALLASALVLIAVDLGRRRLLSLVALALSLGGLTRFLVRVGARNVAESAQHDSEEEAVSRLRDILWAEQQAKSMALVRVGRGEGGYLFLGELVGSDRRRWRTYHAPVLAPDLYRAADRFGGIYRAGGYLFTVYLPGPAGAAREGQPVDSLGSARHFRAFAWPASLRAGRRVFVVDDAGRLCEAPATLQFFPGAFDGKAHPTFDDEPCSGALDHQAWRPWTGQVNDAPRGR